MIQRIQSLFLLAVTVSCFILVIHPIAYVFLKGDSIANFTSFGLRTTKEPAEMLIRALPIAFMATISGLMSLLTIFVYQQRLLQMKLCGYNILLTVLLIIVIFLYYFSIKDKSIIDHVFIVTKSLSYPILLPFVNIILLFQSFRAIRRDDMLIKSYERLR
jgi:hypothetical protein